MLLIVRIRTVRERREPLADSRMQWKLREGRKHEVTKEPSGEQAKKGEGLRKSVGIMRYSMEML